VVVGKKAVHLCPALMVKELKISFEQGRVVVANPKYNQTLNILFSVVKVILKFFMLGI
jgi:hypothetical protein